MKPTTVFFAFIALTGQSMLQGDETSSTHDRKKENVERKLKTKPYKNGSTFVEVDSVDTNLTTVTFDYLIARAYNPGLVYAFEKRGVEEPGSFQNIVMHGKMINPVKTWRPGFQVSVGWKKPATDWSLQSSWAYYYNKSVTNKHISSTEIVNGFSNASQGYVGYWVTRVAASYADAQTNTAVPFLKLQGVWRLNYNMIDLGINKCFFDKADLKLGLNFFLQSGWIHQKSNILYTDSENLGAGADRYLNQNSQLTNDFWGIGFKTGLDGDWNVGAGFSLFGKFFAALLSGRTSARTVTSTFGPNEPIASGNIDIYREALRTANYADRITHYAPGVDATLGIAWSYGLSFGRLISLKAGWKSQVWWAQQKMLLPQERTTGSGGNLTTNYSGANYQEAYPQTKGILFIEGVTVSGQFDF